MALGEADAGIGYTTGVTGAAAGKVGRLDIPDKLNTFASYSIAAIQGSANADAARKFADYVLPADGQAVLAKYGFIAVTGG